MTAAHVLSTLRMEVSSRLAISLFIASPPAAARLCLRSDSCAWSAPLFGHHRLQQGAGLVNLASHLADVASRNGRPPPANAPGAHQRLRTTGHTRRINKVWGVIVRRRPLEAPQMRSRHALGLEDHGVPPAFSEAGAATAQASQRGSHVAITESCSSSWPAAQPCRHRAVGEIKALASSQVAWTRLRRPRSSSTSSEPGRRRALNGCL